MALRGSLQGAKKALVDRLPGLFVRAPSVVTKYVFCDKIYILKTFDLDRSPLPSIIF